MFKTFDIDVTTRMYDHRMAAKENLNKQQIQFSPNDNRIQIRVRFYILPICEIILFCLTYVNDSEFCIRPISELAI